MHPAVEGALSLRPDPPRGSAPNPDRDRTGRERGAALGCAEVTIVVKIQSSLCTAQSGGRGLGA